MDGDPNFVHHDIQVEKYNNNAYWIEMESVIEFQLWNRR